MKKLTVLIGLLFIYLNGFSQQDPWLHSHNDYHQDVPFWKAYSCNFQSIEVDLFLKNGKLYATHDEKEIIENRTIQTLYLDPLQKAYKTGLGNHGELQLLIDFKSEAYSTLKALIKVLRKYPDLIQNNNIKFVISGNRPKAEDYKNYPDYIWFDYQSLDPIPTNDYSKVALISLGFTKYAKWNGKQPMDSIIYHHLETMVKQAHSYNKPFRFWAFPDTELAWETCVNLGIDFVNTDQPFECAKYFEKKTTMTKPLQVAFVADIHLQDIYGELSETDYKGPFNWSNGKHVLMRTMQSQLKSTRIFNENYFALQATLNDIVARNIKLVALPGDYTDDGQLVNVKGLKEMLTKYQNDYGIQFFITTGNHDPVGPFRMEAGKTDFLAEDGKAQPIFSKKGMYTSDAIKEHDVVISPDIAKLGYNEILNELQNFGFYPQPDYLYWATPFSNYNYADYSLEKAVKLSDLKNRQYEVVPGFTVPDVSYVVEPIEGIWLLAIDGDVYIPKDINKSPDDASNYHGASTGYNNVLTNKRHLISWVKHIAEEAKANDKVLIAFSHFPMIDFNDNATPVLKELLGENKWQLERVPNETVAEVFADAGIQIHFAGHMHINDTGVRTTAKGNTIINIQTPSLAAYIPGYKVLTIRNNDEVEVETVVLDDVPGFKSLFPIYKQEHEFLEKQGAVDIWNKEVLESDTYKEYMLWHLKELVRLRFINDWPEPIKSYITTHNLAEIGELAYFYLGDGASGYSGYDLLVDFYKLRNADTLVLQDINSEQLKYYRQLCKAFKVLSAKDILTQQMQQFFECIEGFLNGAPAMHFTIKLNVEKVIEAK